MNSLSVDQILLRNAMQKIRLLSVMSAINSILLHCKTIALGKVVISIVHPIYVTQLQIKNLILFSE